MLLYFSAAASFVLSMFLSSSQHYGCLAITALLLDSGKSHCLLALSTVVRSSGTNVAALSACTAHLILVAQGHSESCRCGACSCCCCECTDDDCADCCSAFWCLPCAVCQDAREISIRGTCIFCPQSAMLPTSMPCCSRCSNPETFGNQMGKLHVLC